MSSNFLEPDHTKRNLVIFSVSLLILASFSGFYFMADRGCKEYTQNLRSCTPFQCTQRVKGFENKYLGKSPAMLTRQIMGREKDKYFDTSTCNVLETDNIDGKSAMFCKYSDNTLNITIMRSDILFGTAPLPAGTSGNTAAQRAAYATRTPEQKAECEKQ